MSFQLPSVVSLVLQNVECARISNSLFEMQFPLPVTMSVD